MDQELRQYLDERFARIDERLAAVDAKIDERFAQVDERFAALDAKIDERHDQTIERMRHAQTELLRVFESFSAGLAVRMRKLEVDQSNLDASVLGRIEVLEQRLLQIEFRLRIV